MLFANAVLNQPKHVRCVLKCGPAATPIITRSNHRVTRMVTATAALPTVRDHLFGPNPTIFRTCSDTLNPSHYALRSKLRSALSPPHTHLGFALHLHCVLIEPEANDVSKTEGYCGSNVPCGFYIWNHSSTTVVHGQTFLEWFRDSCVFPFFWHHICSIARTLCSGTLSNHAMPERVFGGKAVARLGGQRQLLPKTTVRVPAKKASFSRIGYALPHIAGGVIACL
jgi:hypothetical protein